MHADGAILQVELPGARPGVFEDAMTESVSPSYFDMVGARASAGRFFTELDDAVVVISEAYRRRIFGKASGIGQVIKLHTVPRLRSPACSSAPRALGLLDGSCGRGSSGSRPVIHARC